jgi:hypothetical protein
MTRKACPDSIYAMCLTTLETDAVDVASVWMILQQSTAELATMSRFLLVPWHFMTQYGDIVSLYKHGGIDVTVWLDYSKLALCYSVTHAYPLAQDIELCVGVLCFICSPFLLGEGFETVIHVDF